MIVPRNKRLTKLQEDYPDRQNTNHVSLNYALKVSRKFLEQRELESLVVFNEDSEEEGRWQGEFKTTMAVLDYLKRNVNDKTRYKDNYFIAPRDLSWLLLFCHEGDVHVYGSQKVVNKFRKIIE